MTCGLSRIDGRCSARPSAPTGDSSAWRAPPRRRPTASYVAGMRRHSVCAAAMHCIGCANDRPAATRSRRATLSLA
eukprot:131201-Prymnesium_polylepis.1